MGQYSRKDMIEFANFAKSYQSSRNVEEAYQAYLRGERLKLSNQNSIIGLIGQANIVYLDGKLVKNRYERVEAVLPYHNRFDIISWNKEKRELNLKTKES